MLNHVNGIADVAVTDGKIAAVGRELTGEAKETVDLTGLVLQPGIIDSHVHLGSMWGSPYGCLLYTSDAADEEGDDVP